MDAFMAADTMTANADAGLSPASAARARARHNPVPA
jgi:hypothetical protein